MYDDEPEFTEPVTGKIPLKIEVTGWTLDGLLRAVVEATQKHAATAINDAIKDTVTKAVDRAVLSLVAEKVGPMIDEVLLNGWTVTDDYGREKGKKTVRDIIITELTKTDRYHNNGKNFMEAKVTAIVEQVANKELAPAIEEARKKLKEQFDAVLHAKFAATVREALGLRT